MSDEAPAALRPGDQISPPPTRLVEIALAIAATGLPVFPCTLNGAPAISKQRGGNGFKDAVTDFDAVRALFARARPSGLVGVPTGTITDRLVLDIDPRHGGDQWEDAHRDRLPHTLIHKTKNGGRHYVFRDTPGVRISAGQVSPGVDVRSSGGYAVWPPSQGYSVINEAEPARVPEWLIELIRKAPEPERPAIIPSDPAAITDRRVRGLLDSLLGNVKGAPEGLKHATLLAIARTIGGYLWLLPYDEDQLVGLLLDALPATVENWTKAARTARDGLRHGAQTPLDFEERRSSPKVKGNGGPAAASPLVGQKRYRSQGEGEGESEPDEDTAAGARNGEFGTDQPAPEADPLRADILPPELLGCELTEDGVARAFAIERGNELRFCHGPNRWHLWDGTRWKPEPTKLAFHWVRTLARRMARMADKASLRATLGKAAFASGVERMASTDRVFAVPPDHWDRDPWLLGTPGGTVDLRTGILHRPSRMDFISRQTLVTRAEPGAPCPIWMQFLAEVTRNDADLIGFLRQWFGYSLCGITREEALTFIYGPGGNGKGVLMHAIFAIMGDYAVNAAIDAFTVTFTDKHTTDIAMLNGARMVMATEIEEGRAWAEARIKALTGRDPITARFMRQDNVTFIPIFKLSISGNHKPRLRNVDDAAKRRINIVPFLNRPAVVDPQLAEKLEPEYPVILRWLIDGCVSWQVNGLMPPKVVTETTAEYFEDEDYFTRWLDECCSIFPQLTVRPAALLHSFQAWCKANGEEETDNKRLRSMLERVPGVKYIKSNGVREFRGIALNAPEPDERFG